jgi:hypothetical protein
VEEVAMLEGIPVSAEGLVGVAGIGTILLVFIICLQRGILWTGAQVQRLLDEKEVRLKEKDEANEKLELVIETKNETDRIRDATLAELINHLGELTRQGQTTEKVVNAIKQATGVEGGST